MLPPNTHAENHIAHFWAKNRKDPHKALALLDHSRAIDPALAQTFLLQADAYLSTANEKCGLLAGEEEPSSGGKRLIWAQGS